MPGGGSLAISLHGVEVIEELPAAGVRLPPRAYAPLEVADMGTGMEERGCARTCIEPGRSLCSPRRFLGS